MAELNAFETDREPLVPGSVVTLATVAVGLVAVVAAFAVDPLGPLFVLLVWGFVLGGLVLAVLPGRARHVGVGLAFAGAAVPVAAFLFLVVVISGGVLFG
ncbi:MULTISPECIES: hypothetical protein [unclassified Nocardioides]|uniref:hypothetical protein n=1 Tax=unclassified Nocardioides TaxID=2615069 RepID=UPI0012E3B9AB|nr:MULTISPECIES: hypothetical protein [unclassified Nocardioides]